MHIPKSALKLVLSAFMLVGGSGIALGQAGPGSPVYTSNEDYPVMQRPRPGYDAKGIPLGGFRLFPSLRLDGIYDDNVLRTQTGAISDYAANILPSLRLTSQWNEDLLEFQGGASNYNYQKLTRENLTDWNAGADGRFIITTGSSISGAGSAAEMHELLSSPNTVGFQVSPNRYFLYHGDAAISVNPAGRLGLTVTGSADNNTYLNTPLIGGGILNNKDRSFNEYQGSAKASYNFSPGYSAFVRGSYDTRQFKVHLDRTGVRRSSNGYRANGGIDLQVSRLVSGQIYAGYLNQRFKAPLKSVSGIDYGVNLDWLARPVLTVHLVGSRNLNATTLAGAASEDDKSIGLSADYELLRNLIVQEHASFVDTSYPGITRHDQAPDLGMGFKYLINQYLSASLSYDYTQRATKAAGAKFKDNTVRLGLNLQD